MSYQFKQTACYTPGRSMSVDMIVIHFTAGATLSGTVDWFSNPKSRASAHYVIGRDGTVVQMVHDGDKAWHAGKSEWGGRSNCNNFSIGIELVNWGNLKLDGYYVCWPGNWTRVYNAQRYGQPSKVGDWWWAPYPEEQLAACVKLVREIRTRYPAITDERVLGHSDVSPGRKLDPGPLFPMDILRDESRPEPMVLPPEAYQDDPGPKNHMEEGDLDRSGKTGWLEDLCELFRRK